MMSCEICGGKVALKVGFDGLAESLMAYCRASFSLRKYNDGSSASTKRLSTGDVRKAPRASRRPWW